MSLSQSQEDYLETVYLISTKEDVVRVRDVAKRLGVKNPSVVAAVKTLVEKGLMTHEHYGSLKLTTRGRLVAKSVYESHQVLFAFINKVLGVDAKIAEQDACLLEHHISPATKKRLIKFIEFTRKVPNDDEEPRFLMNFRNYLKTGEIPICQTETEEM